MTRVNRGGGLEVHRLEGFTGGWLVGNFDPTLWKQDGVEVAVKHYRPGDRDEAHVHKVGTEITCIVYGRVRLGDVELVTGDVLVLKPGEAMPGDWVVIDPTATVCIKYPSAPGDKYPV